MDYTNDPGSNQHPNAHDYEMLESIYAHLDSSTTIKQESTGKNGLDVDENDPSSWGKSLKESSNKRSSLYERDFGNGDKIFTFVIWAE